MGNTDIKLVGAAVAITALAIAYSSHVWGWKPLEKSSKYAKTTLYLGALNGSGSYLQLSLPLT